MSELDEVKGRIKGLIKEYFSLENENKEAVVFVPGKTKIPLVVPSYDWNEVCEAVDSLLDTRVTMGEKVRQFESEFARYIGVRHGVAKHRNGTELNHVAVTEAVPRDRLPLHEGAVGGAQILEEVSVTVPDELGVASTDIAILQPEV